MYYGLGRRSIHTSFTYTPKKIFEWKIKENAFCGAVKCKVTFTSFHTSIREDWYFNSGCSMLIT